MVVEEKALSQEQRIAFAAEWTRAVLAKGVCPDCGDALRPDTMAGWYRCPRRKACLFLMYVGVVRNIR